MTKIVRTPTKATGGITDAERDAMKKHADLWISRAMRTTPVDVDEITSAVHDLYAAAGLKQPRVVVVPSPLVMAFAYGASAAIWWNRKTANATDIATDIATAIATRNATDIATDIATRNATDIATRNATDIATHNATRSATRSATANATANATDIATRNATDDATHNATRNATDIATHNATHNATANATYNATRNATDDATHNATRNATDNATYNATDIATRNATANATANATYNATDIATRNATRNATDDATHNATANATYNATDIATRNATDDATYNATDIATRNATDDATHNATANATYNATDIATRNATANATCACIDLAGNLGLACSKRWGANYHGGAYWAGYDSYLTAMRDIIGLRLPEHEKYAAWERCAIAAPFRVLHEEFCIVSDFPEILKVDDENRPHCETGPSHRWRDGWALYHWHGVSIPAEWIEFKQNLTARTALTWPNIEQRRAACEIIGWDRILSELKARIIDEDDDPQVGTLVEVSLPDAGKERFLKVRCGTSRNFAIPVPRHVKTAIQAQAWTYGFDHVADYQSPEVRT